jgi:hypothetical protein
MVGALYLDRNFSLAGLAGGWLLGSAASAHIVSVATGSKRVVELDVFWLAPWRAGIHRHTAAAALDNNHGDYVLAHTSTGRCAPDPISALGKFRCGFELFSLAAKSSNSGLIRQKKVFYPISSKGGKTYNHSLNGGLRVYLHQK